MTKLKLLMQMIHLRVWFSISMMYSYLAYHRGEMVLSAEYENDAIWYESELHRLQILN